MIDWAPTARFLGVEHDGEKFYKCKVISQRRVDELRVGREDVVVDEEHAPRLFRVLQVAHLVTVGQDDHLVLLDVEQAPAGAGAVEEHEFSAHNRRGGGLEHALYLLGLLH